MKRAELSFSLLDTLTAPLRVLRSAALFPENGGCSALAAAEPLPNTVAEPLRLPVEEAH